MKEYHVHRKSSKQIMWVGMWLVFCPDFEEADILLWNVRCDCSVSGCKGYVWDQESNKLCLFIDLMIEMLYYIQLARDCHRSCGTNSTDC